MRTKKIPERGDRFRPGLEWPRSEVAPLRARAEAAGVSLSRWVLEACRMRCIFEDRGRELPEIDLKDDPPTMF